MTKSLYILGLVAFIWSFFTPTTPQVMTSSEGEAVALWRLYMEDASSLVRYKSAHGLEPLGTIAAPGVLKLDSLLTDPDEKVRHCSARALARLEEVARPTLPALKTAREKEQVAGNKGLMDGAIRKLSSDAKAK